MKQILEQQLKSQMFQVVKTFKNNNIRVTISQSLFAHKVTFEKYNRISKMYVQELTLFDLIAAHDLLKDAAIYLKQKEVIEK